MWQKVRRWKAMQEVMQSRMLYHHEKQTCEAWIEGEKNLRGRKCEEIRENSKEQDGKKAARKRLCGESRRGIATFHGEFIRWDWISPRFQVRLTSSDFLFAHDRCRSTSTYFTLHLGTLKRVAPAIDTFR